MTKEVAKQISIIKKIPPFSIIVFTSFSGIFLLAGWNLSLDTLEMYRQPGINLSCDFNAKVSCSEVAKTWQANLVNWFGIQAPNAFFVIGAGAVLLTIGVALISKVKFPKWFIIATYLGTAAGLVFAYWLLYQSMFVIEKLCPWCLIMMISMTFCFMSINRFIICHYIPKLKIEENEYSWPFIKEKTFNKINEFCDNKLDLIIYIGWIVIITTLILVVEHSAFGF
ncbi:MAG: hypothetical protein LBT85_02865 [Bifidobacteriaceae bacterium]|jgi:uncharacterized membrane protein|nr:hypothetical protein [Bifidobacteriaceae bacterium]